MIHPFCLRSMLLSFFRQELFSVLFILRTLRLPRTKTALRLSATALHKFPKPFSVRLWLRSKYLYNLTKNLTVHLRHYLCAVLP